MPEAESLKLIQRELTGTFIIRISQGYPDLLMIQIVIAPGVVRDYKIPQENTNEEIFKIIDYFPHLQQYINSEGQKVPIQKFPMELRATRESNHYVVRYDPKGKITSVNITPLDD